VIIKNIKQVKSRHKQ